MIVETTQATAYRCTTANSRRFLTKTSAYRDAARQKIKSKCECERAEDDYPGQICRYHRDQEQYVRLVRRLARIYERADRKAPRATETTSEPTQGIITLAKQLYAARLEAKQAKKDWQEAAAKAGMCEWYDETDLPSPQCWQTTRPAENWCCACKTKQPAWENYHRKTNAAAGALRALLNAAKKL